MATDRVDFPSSRAHFGDHLLPVFHELGRRGVHTWMNRVSPDQEPYNFSRDLDDAAGRVTVVSASADMMAASRAKRCVVLMEHGAGQHYSNRNSSYVGGRGRSHAALVLVPNDQAAQRHQQFYAHPRAVVVGCPKLDQLVGTPAPRTNPPTVCVSWHWDANQVSPEARSAWPFGGVELLDVLVTEADRGAISLIGSAHPRILEKIRPFYEARGVPIVTGDEVYRRADVLVADNTSLMFEFAALDRPVVVIDAPVYRRWKNHGLRFWDCADIGPRALGPGAWRDALYRALDPDEGQVERRREIISRVYPYLGEASARAADAIQALL